MFVQDSKCPTPAGEREGDCESWWEEGPAPQEDSLPASAPDGGDRDSEGKVVRTLQEQNNRV